MRQQSTTKKVELQTRRELFNYHLKGLLDVSNKDRELLIKRLIEKGDSVSEIADYISKHNLPITNQRVSEIARSK